MKNLLYAQPRVAPPTADQVIEALDIARCIVKLGWAQRVAHTVNGEGQDCYCLVAAITMASRTTQIRDTAIMACRMALPGRFVNHTLEQFNDHSATAVGDVAWLLTAGKAMVGRAVA